MQKPEKWMKPWHMDTHPCPKVLSESCPMNTNMAGFDGFQKALCYCGLSESSLSIRKVNKPELANVM